MTDAYDDGRCPPIFHKLKIKKKVTIPFPNRQGTQTIYTVQVAGEYVKSTKDFNCTVGWGGGGNCKKQYITMKRSHEWIDGEDYGSI